VEAGSRPVATLPEAGLVEGIEVLGAETLRELLGWLRGHGQLRRPGPTVVAEQHYDTDLDEVVGQAEARWAIEVAAAGAHHLLLTGPPGTGKTMLAQRLPGLLPPLGDQEALEVTAIHSVAGLLSTEQPLITRPVFVAPHHTSSVSALVGGGSGMARPGAVSQAHRGVLFLDECPEFGSRALEALRTPLEDGEVRIARRDGVARYPARFQLVLAANPCPCAPARELDCVCARPRCGGATSAVCQVRCWTGWTCASRCGESRLARSPMGRRRAPQRSASGSPMRGLRQLYAGPPMGGVPMPKYPGRRCASDSAWIGRPWRRWRSP